MSHAPRASSTGSASAEGPILELRHVYKSFGPLDVLKDVSLQVQRGRILVILGASGSGKSVMLKLMIGLLKPDAGEVYFKGRRIDTLPENDLVEVREHMGFVFQMGALFDSMSVAENVAFPLREHTGYDDAKIAQIVREKLRNVGLESIGPKSPTAISGGQRKRVAIARALVMDPEVIFLDEPTTGLDPIRSDIMNELALKLRNDLHVTEVVVTHDMASAFKIADRIVMLHEGTLIADGTVDEIRRSSDPHVRQFIEGKASDEDLESIRTR